MYINRKFYQEHDENKKKRIKAAALGYDQEKDIAPKMLAKGGGLVAEKIIEMAKENNIPIKEDPFLVAALQSLDVDEVIPPELYKVVAEVLAYIYRVKTRTGG
jgi:flagellar biosynthesis protein